MAGRLTRVSFPWRLLRPSGGRKRTSSRREAAGTAGRQSDPPHWSAMRYEQNARFVADYGIGVLEVLSPKATERILDLGCGDGALTAELQQAGCSVTGVDSSPDMIKAACGRGLDARVVDGHSLPFHQEFDAVFSNAALHWMKKDPAAVVRGVKAALKPGGRFIGEFGGHGNVGAITVALSAALTAHGHNPAERHPWFFPSKEEYQCLLEASGFEVQSVELFPRPTPLPTGIAGWLATFAGPWLSGLDEQQQSSILEETEALLEPVLKQQHNGVWVADYVRLRFSASLPPTDAS